MEEFSRKYFKLLTEDYAGINLTRINEYNEFYLKQIIDSLAPQKQSRVFKESIQASKHIIDVGFGGGFPILPLAFTNPDKSFLGIETRAKKAKVVGEISSKLEIFNTQFIHSRVENVLIDIPAVVTFKAVGKVYDFLSKINTSEKLQVFFYKGPNFYSLEKDQIAEAKKEWKLIEETEIEVEGTEKRYLIGFENIKVPHGTKPSPNSSSLVKISEII